MVNFFVTNGRRFCIMFRSKLHFFFWWTTHRLVPSNLTISTQPANLPIFLESGRCGWTSWHFHVKLSELIRLLGLGMVKMSWQLMDVWALELLVGQIYVCPSGKWILDTCICMCVKIYILYIYIYYTNIHAYIVHARIFKHRNTLYSGVFITCPQWHIVVRLQRCLASSWSYDVLW